jgi:hypothetical protein
VLLLKRGRREVPVVGTSLSRGKITICLRPTKCLLNERIAFAIVPDEVRYPDRIVGIALLLWSMQ